MDDLKQLKRTLAKKAKDARIAVETAEGELAVLDSFKPPARKNKLVSDARRYRHLLATGEPIDEERASGRTTARALLCLSQAMCSPGVCIVCKDHRNASGLHPRDIEVARLAIHLASQLELRYFKVTLSQPPTILYTVMEG